MQRLAGEPGEVDRDVLTGEGLLDEHFHDLRRTGNTLFQALERPSAS